MLTVEHESGVTIMTLENGKVNTLDIELLNDLSKQFRALRNSDGGSVVITGAGRAFSAGVDLVSIVNRGSDYVKSFLAALSAAILDIFQCPLPVVAAINGHAIAGGCLLAIAADVRVMGEGKIGLPEFTVGVPLPVAGVEVLRSVAGRHASHVLTSAALLDARNARDVGLVSMVTTENPLSTACEEAHRLATVRPTTFALAKRQLRAPAMASIEANLDEDSAVEAAWLNAVENGSIQEYLESLSR